MTFTHLTIDVDKIPQGYERDYMLECATKHNAIVAGFESLAGKTPEEQEDSSEVMCLARQGKKWWDEHKLKLNLSVVMFWLACISFILKTFGASPESVSQLITSVSSLISKVASHL